MNNSTLTYQGKVKVARYKNGRLKGIKTLKNEGTWILFNFICNCLGNGVDERDRPRYLDVYKVESPTTANFTEEGNRLTIGNLPILTISSIGSGGSNDDPCSIIFQTTLTSSYLSGSSPQNGNVYYVLKNNTDAKNVIAYVDSGLTSLNIATDEVYIITWELRFENSTIAESTAASESSLTPTN